MSYNIPVMTPKKNIVLILKATALVLFLIFAVLNLINYYSVGNVALKLVSYIGGALSALMYLGVYIYEAIKVNKKVKAEEEAEKQNNENDSQNQNIKSDEEITVNVESDIKKEESVIKESDTDNKNKKA